MASSTYALLRSLERRLQKLDGVIADVVDLHGKPVEPNREGFLIIRRPWPAMARTLWREPERYRQQYWERIPGVYLAGDAALAVQPVADLAVMLEVLTTFFGGVRSIGDRVLHVFSADGYLMLDLTG
jgi:hypothetical protein